MIKFQIESSTIRPTKWVKARIKPFDTKAGAEDQVKYFTDWLGGLFKYQIVEVEVADVSTIQELPEHS